MVFRISKMNKIYDLRISSLVLFYQSERRMLLICSVLSKVCHKDCVTHLNLNVKGVARFGSVETGTKERTLF